MRRRPGRRSGRWPPPIWRRSLVWRSRLCLVWLLGWWLCGRRRGWARKRRDGRDPYGRGGVVEWVIVISAILRSLLRRRRRRRSGHIRGSPSFWRRLSWNGGRTCSWCRSGRDWRRERRRCLGDRRPDGCGILETGLTLMRLQGVLVRYRRWHISIVVPLVLSDFLIFVIVLRMRHGSRRRKRLTRICC